MSGLKELKARISSVTNTQQMTKAMKMVSAARLRSAQSRILNLRHYANSLEEVLRDVVLTQKVHHPFLEQKKEEDIQKVLYVILTSDRGLCGGFNGNICRYTEKIFKEAPYKQKDLFFIGKKGDDYFKFRNIQGTDQPLLNLVKDVSYTLSVKISKNLMEKTLSQKYDAVFIVYNEFKTVISPRIVSERFLPFDLFSERLSQKDKGSTGEDFIFEVPPQVLLKNLLERYFNIQIYRCLCENVAAEHGSRMAAMENASTNAEEMKEKLSLKFNKLRQGAITTELIEIISGVEALK